MMNPNTLFNAHLIFFCFSLYCPSCLASSMFWKAFKTSRMVKNEFLTVKNLKLVIIVVLYISITSTILIISISHSQVDLIYLGINLSYLGVNSRCLRINSSSNLKNMTLYLDWESWLGFWGPTRCWLEVDSSFRLKKWLYLSRESQLRTTSSRLKDYATWSLWGMGLFLIIFIWCSLPNLLSLIFHLEQYIFLQMIIAFWIFVNIHFNKLLFYYILKYFIFIKIILWINNFFSWWW